MSEHLKIGIGAERVMCLRTGGALRAEVREKHQIDIEPQPAERLWEGPLRALDAYLKTRKERRTPTSVVLSNRLVRYVVLPWHEAVVTRSERRAQAHHHFRQIYGETADAWSIACSAPRYGKASLATAVDAGLIAGLRDVLARSACRLRSIQPYLPAVQTVFCKSSPSATTAHFFCVIEQGYMSCLELENGAPRNVFNQRMREDWRSELNGIFLEAGLQGARTESSNVSVFAPDSAWASSGEQGDGFKRLLPRFPAGLSPVADGRFAMALMASP